MQSTDTRYFTDDQITASFNLSVSSMRVAQRACLVESRVTQFNRRYVRAWSPTDVIRVFLARTTDEMLVIPFVAACQIIAMFRPRELEAVDRVIAQRSDENYLPVVRIINREHVIFRSKALGAFYAGCLRRGEQGRSYFDANTGDQKTDISQFEATAVAEFRCSIALAKFKSQHGDLLQTRELA